MEKVKIRIEGISPLIMHRFAVDDDLTQKISKSKKKDQKRTQDDVKQYLYTNEDGKLVQPSTHIIGCMKKAGAKFLITGGGKQTYKNIIGSGAVIINPDMILHEKQEWEVDKRAVVIKQARIIRERPILKKWSLTFEAEYDEDEIPKSTLNEILEHAGKRVGIGDFRPEKGGPYGRFMITEFK